ncbi:T9SS type B sorting domain-containing protein [uncultured Algibacter sp.]|uniref:T9SS type B sorting domain-containing protein n=1 Tax=uncultured Algibacter sp. TaxID=298659 RepID=UPI0026203AA2|nr:T9SS type B sorting domain-containing protein [uncultured Algibacter sp.]
MNFKTKFLLISFCCIIIINSFSQNTFIPDDNFEQALIDLGFDTPPLDDNVPTANINSITNLDIATRNISDLTGIQDFQALTNLDCSENQLSVLDVTQNTNLTELYCSNNMLTNLDVTNQTNLVRLWCFNNQLSSLDVSLKPNLISFRCENNQLTSLNISNLTGLNILTCEQNQIMALDVSDSANLSRLQCGNNQLTNLDVNNNTNLSFLSCEQNQITNLNLRNNNRLAFLYCFNNQISVLDLTQNSTLTDLNCSNNQLCTLNINNGNNSNLTAVNFDTNPDLDCVIVDNSNGNHSTWMPTSFTNYVETPSACSSFVSVDVLPNIIGTSYTLPTLNNGDYFTESGGMGTQLNPGDNISTSQTIYIFNETTCNSNESSFSVIINNDDYFIPKYFTPNNDGANDVWQVYDRLNLVNNISIYNRHGKLIKFLPSSASSWDGTFNGQLLNSGSYWYEIVLNTREIIRGYFALKR